MGKRGFSGTTTVAWAIALVAGGYRRAYSAARHAPTICR